MKHLLLFTIGLFALVSGPAVAETFEVAVDHARVLHLPRPAAAVIVGNPAIADAAVFDGGLLFITGKTFGATNFIALDSEGKTIMSRDLKVMPSESRLTLHLGSVQHSYMCTDGCEPAPGIGDDADTFQRLMDQQTAKSDQGQAAADAN
jgi:Flp pilus assembly secretin CpaC